MFKIIMMTSTVLFSFITVSVYNLSYASNTNLDIDFSLHLEAPDPNDLTDNSPQKDLRDAYNNIREIYNPNQLMNKINEFKKFIYAPVDFPPDNNQTEFLKEIRSLKAKLEKSFFREKFSDAITVLGNRIDNARIDAQVFRNQALRGINHADFSPSLRNALNEVIGKIFYTTLNDNEEEVTRSGSAILVSLDPTSNLPMTLVNGGLLNGIMTCAHVIATDKDERAIGAYFVPNKYLDHETGFPLAETVEDEESLGEYLENPSEEVYRLSTYFTKQRTENDFKLSKENDILSANPQYRRNEDMVFVKFENTPITYNHNVKINFFNVCTKQLTKFSDNEKYYAIGYPACDHHDTTFFQDHDHEDLVENMSCAPLFVTSASVQASNFIPVFEQGKIRHKAPTASGMSGGVIIQIAHEIENTIETEIIYIMGNIASGVDDNENGCY